MFLGIYTTNLKNNSMENLHVSVYSSFNDNHQKLEVIQITFIRLIDKQTVVYPIKWNVILQ